MGSTYASHELENAGLSLVEEDCDFIEAVHQLHIFANCAGHATSQSIAQVVIDVEFARGARSQECIVET